MSKDRDTMMLVGLGAIAFLYLRSRTTVAGAVPVRAGAVATMPASAGAGWQQIGASALVGFLQTAAQSLTGNNGSSTYVSSLNNGQQIATDYSQSSTVQDVAYPFDWGAANYGYPDQLAYA